MKRYLILMFMIMAFIFSTDREAYALVNLTGSLEWTLGATPSSTQYYGTDGWYGVMRNEQNITPYTWTYPVWNASGNMYLDANYEGNNWFGSSHATGGWNSTTGKVNLLADSVAPDLTTDAVTYPIMRALLRFESLATFPAYSYLYDFKGTTDSAGDEYDAFLAYSLSYLGNVNGSWQDVYVYTNLHPLESTYHTDYPRFNGTGGGLILDESETRSFGPYSAAGGSTNWYLYYEIFLKARDRGSAAQDPGVVPEPSSMLLLGIGFMGARYFRRKKKA